MFTNEKKMAARKYRMKSKMTCITLKSQEIKLCEQKKEKIKRETKQM